MENKFLLTFRRELQGTSSFQRRGKTFSSIRRWTKYEVTVV